MRRLHELFPTFVEGWTPTSTPGQLCGYLSNGVRVDAITGRREAEHLATL